MPPETLDVAIIFATASRLVPMALKAVRKCGRVVLLEHPHERHPELPLCAALGRTRAASSLPTSPSGKPKRTAATVAVAKRPSRVNPMNIG
jgi:hypothetical protein